MKIDYTNLSFTQLIDKIEANRFFDLPRMVREAFRRLLTRVEALEDAPSGDSRPYKVYTALLTQSGTDAPVATVLENTLGGDIVWSRYNTGEFFADTTGNLFTSNKTFTTVTNRDITTLQFISVQSENQIYLEQVLSETLNYTDFMNIVPVEIRVYN